VGLGLGAQAGESRLRQVATEAGFKRFRRATETPFNMIFEVRCHRSEQRCASARMLQEMRPAEPCMHSGLMSPIGHRVDISVSAFAPLLEVKRT
jgi:hypothetical protein